MMIREICITLYKFTKIRLINLDSQDKIHIKMLQLQLTIIMSVFHSIVVTTLEV